VCTLRAPRHPFGVNFHSPPLAPVRLGVRVKPLPGAFAASPKRSQRASEVKVKARAESVRKRGTAPRLHCSGECSDSRLRCLGFDWYRMGCFPRNINAYQSTQKVSLRLEIRCSIHLSYTPAKRYSWIISAASVQVKWRDDSALSEFNSSHWLSSRRWRNQRRAPQSDWGALDDSELRSWDGQGLGVVRRGCNKRATLEGGAASR